MTMKDKRENGLGSRWMTWKQPPHGALQPN